MFCKDKCGLIMTFKIDIKFYFVQASSYIYMSQCQNSSKFLSVSYLMKTADVIMIFFLHTILLIILNKAS